MNILSLYWNMERCKSQRNTCFRDEMKLFKMIGDIMFCEDIVLEWLGLLAFWNDTFHASW